MFSVSPPPAKGKASRKGRFCWGAEFALLGGGCSQCHKPAGAAGRGGRFALPVPRGEKEEEEEKQAGSPSRMMWLKGQIFVKLAGFLLTSLAAWHIGCFLAYLIPKETIKTSVANLQDIGKQPLLRAPSPKRQKCDHWSPCPLGDYAYRILSGGGKAKLAKICFEDELLISEEKGNVGRGINIAIVNFKTGKVTSARYFDMWNEDRSGEMMTFINKAPEGSLLLMVTQDDGSTRLKNDAKTLVEKLGSKEIWNMKFRSSWAFIAAKGFKLPDNIQKEKIEHSDKKNNKYGGWPAEVQIEGCIPRNLI